VAAGLGTAAVEELLGQLALGVPPSYPMASLLAAVGELEPAVGERGQRDAPPAAALAP
jgi:hypothetical protein